MLDANHTPDGWEQVFDMEQALADAARGHSGSAGQFLVRPARRTGTRSRGIWLTGLPCIQWTSSGSAEE